MELGDILIWVFLMAIVVALLLVVSGNFFKLRVEIVSSKQFLLTYSILNSYISSSNFLIDRLLISRSFFNEWNDREIEKIESYELNYVVNFSNESVNRYIANFDGPFITQAFKENSCYIDSGMLKKSMFESYVAICEKEFFCKPIRVRIISLVTPLSQLAYYLTYSCLSTLSFEKRIKILLNDFRSLSIGKGKVCLNNVCQTYTDCGLKLEIIKYDAVQECSEIIVNFLKTEKKIFVKVPKK
ncbi:MAG: hypothetical protein RMJ17_01405 [Candidatus Aenigmarchaeota archaeon]|nr:hypothetical protein [Candidatus Aenigmarchaeota archaeon]MDW8149237.1 hypothetical protein [Candidatus Aenigmarchaeota archaeon]